MRCPANPDVDKKAHTLFDADAPCANAAIADDLRDTTIRTLVFFPGADVSAEFDQLTRALFFELGTNPGEFAALRDDEGEHALALAPAHAGEVIHAGSRLDIDGVDLLLSHQALRFRDPGSAFVVGDRHYAGSHAAQILDHVRTVLSLLNRIHVVGVGERELAAEQRRSGNSSGKAQKVSSVSAHG